MRRQWQQPSPFVFSLTYLPIAASILLHSLALTPLYLTLICDVTWKNTVLPPIVAYLQLFLEYAFFWFLFAFLARTAGNWNPVAIILPIALSCLVRHGLEIVMGYVVMGFPTWAEFCEDELVYTLLQLLFDALLIAAAAILAKVVKKSRLRALLMAALPTLFQIVSLIVMFCGYDKPSRSAHLAEALIDSAFHILCFFAGFGVISLWNRLLWKERLQ